MSSWSVRFLNSKLSERTSIFGLQLWVVVGTIVGAGILFVLYLLSHCLASRQRPHSGDTAESDKHRRGKLLKFHLQDPTPPVSKEISEILHADSPATAAGSVHGAVDVQIDIVKTDRRVLPVEQKHQGPVPPAAWPSPSTRDTSSGDANDTPSSAGGSGGSVGTPEASHLGWGRRYTLQELVDATGGLAPENVIGEGGYGIVYRGVLADNTKVAIKSLLNNGGQAEKEFKVEVEATGRVRHKNLVGLLGYCTEGAYRMLVYEYVDNGNLDQWLHGDAGEVSPLTWDIRVNIILGTAKGLAYLHEGLEPKVVHRDIKAGNLLLDRQWNPKLADFGLAKLICSERSHITTRVIGTFGYVAPEYASTGMLNERSDVYSFGVLIMEIISGRPIVDYTRPPGEVNLVEWLKNMVSNGKSEEVVDLRMPEKPPQKTFKRVLLVALRCVDPDAKKRPKMGHVVQMLEMDELLNRDNCKNNQLVHPH